MIDLLKNNLPYILAIALPIAFFSAGLLVKFSLGQRDFHFFGGDLGFTGCAILCSTALRQIFLRRLTDSDEIVVAVLAIIIFLAVWYGCLVLGRAKILWRSLVALCAGSGAFYLCAFLSWRIIDLGTK